MDSPDTSAASAAAAEQGAGLRRRLIGAGLLGLTGALLPSLASRAGASSGDGEAATTTAPPKRPTDDDVTQLGFAQSVELAAVDLYDAAITGNSLSDTVLPIFQYVREAHLAYAEALSALLGRQAPGTPLADVVDASKSAFSSGGDAAIASAAFELENIANATHIAVLGELQGVDGAKLVASIAVVEARFALTFADLAGETSLDALLVNEAEALSAEKG